MSSTDDPHKMQAQWDEARAKSAAAAKQVQNVVCKQIRDLVNVWLEDMVEDNRVYGAVNWADLQVVDVILCRSGLTDQEWIAVVIEEASPDCGLPGPVYEKLKAEYPMLEFEVRCEW